MNYKLDYISRLFQRTSSKRIEHYVITRIWHLLDDYDIKMTPQQYVSREQVKYALTDVYFPQIGFHLEVNEPAHYESEDRIQKDLKRQNEIEKNTGHRIFTIDCRKDLIAIHRQIDDLVSTIKVAISQKKKDGVFKPWRPEIEHNPNHWKEKGEIAISDDVSFYTIEDICLLFGVDPNKIKRGYLRKGAISHPDFPDLLLWWPSERQRSGWQNYYDEINGTITETHSAKEKKLQHYQRHSKVTDTRVVFFHYKDILGRTNYKFVGVFTNDKSKSKKEIGTVYVRIGERLNLETGKFSQETQ